MKRILFSSLLSVFLIQITQAQELKNTADSIGYAMGVFMAESFKAQGLMDANFDMAMKAMKDVFADGKLIMDQMTASQFLTDYIKNTKEKAGKEFLAQNAKRKEVKTTASGLQYEVLQEGTGAIPDPNDKVKVHYHGTLVDGTVFDSSVDRGEPISFPVNGVIKGWVEALQMMKTGAKWKLYIPSDLAYGNRQVGKIPAYSTLIFEVELLDIEGKNGGQKK